MDAVFGLSNILRTLAVLVASVVTLGVMLWTAGAIYYDAGGSLRLSVVFVAAWFVAVTAAFFLWEPLWAFAVVGCVFAPFLYWWFSQKPSQDRDWNPDFAELPYIETEGDALTFGNVRTTQYRNHRGFTPRYELPAYS